jgi:hypothetical protein
MFCLLYFFMQLVKMMVEEIFFVQKAFICSNLKSPFGPPKYNRISYVALTLERGGLVIKKGTMMRSSIFLLHHMATFEWLHVSHLSRLCEDIMVLQI